jgi:RNA polymerase sigma-70 factor, ECF subfamily
VNVQYSGTLDESDTSLVEKAKQGDRAAIDRLVAKHWPRLLNMVYHLVGHREDAEDLAQETFAKALQRLDSFQGRSQFFTWLYRIATNLAISQRRRRRVETVRPREGLDLDQQRSGDAEVAPVNRLADAEQIDRLRASIARLDPERRAVLVLRDVDGLDYEQIAEILQIPAGTVRSRLHRARLDVRQWMLMGQQGDGVS